MLLIRKIYILHDLRSVMDTCQVGGNYSYLAK